MMVERIQRKRQTERPENTRFVRRRSKCSLIEVGFDMPHYLTELVVLSGFWHSRRSTGKLFVFDATPLSQPKIGSVDKIQFFSQLVLKTLKMVGGKDLSEAKANPDSKYMRSN